MAKIIQNRGAIELRVLNLRAPAERTKADWIAFMQARNAADVLSKSKDTMLLNFRDGLREKLVTHRAGVREAKGSVQYQVCIRRPGISVESIAPTSSEALKLAKEKLVNIRLSRQSSLADTRGRFSGVRNSPGWFSAEMKRRRRQTTHDEKAPTDPSKHVGIEIECASLGKHSQIIEAAVDLGLHKWVNVGKDGSIKEFPVDYIPTELRVLAPESQLRDIIFRTCKLLGDFDARVNATCGLHVHLDCRPTSGRDVKKVYRRLVLAQRLLTSMVPSHRRGNRYCSDNEAMTMPSTYEDAYRFKVVNHTAYQKHKTIEVRVHSGTTNPDKIAYWIELLIAIADGPDIDPFPYRLKTIGEKLNLRPELVKYIGARIAKFNIGKQRPFIDPLKISDGNGTGEIIDGPSEVSTKVLAAKHVADDEDVRNTHLPDRFRPWVVIVDKELDSTHWGHEINGPLPCAGCACQDCVQARAAA